MESVAIGLPCMVIGYALGSLPPPKVVETVKPISEERKKVCEILQTTFTPYKFMIHHHVYCLENGAEETLAKYNFTH